MFYLIVFIVDMMQTGSPIAVQHTPPAEKPQSTIKPAIHATPKPTALALPSFSAERPHVCPYEGCGKAYIHSYKLNLHLKTQHPEHGQEDNGRFAAPSGEYNYAEASDPAPNPKRSKTNQAHKAPPPNAYNVKVSSRMGVDTSGAKNQWPGKGMYDDDSEETEEDHGGNNVEDGWRYGNQNADDEETEEDED
jgi:hypothetical protein